MIQLRFFILFVIITKQCFAFSDKVPKCMAKPCVPQCCPRNKHVIDNMCQEYNYKLNFSDFPVYYDKNYETGETVKDLFELSDAEFNISNTPTVLWPVVLSEPLKFYLNKDGILYLEYPNQYERWRQMDYRSFCIDYNITNDSHDAAFWIDVSNTGEDNGQTWRHILSWGLLISCFFMLLVLVVYCLLPELRNFCGKILMTCVANLFIAYFLLMTFRLIEEDIDLEEIYCKFFTFSIYFSMLSSFFWMNVMSFDIWRTFRGYAKARDLNRRGSTKKYLAYAAYAWGVPTAMTIAVISLHYADLRHIPWFIKPNINCFMADGEKFLYLYVPMLIIMVCNWTFFVSTASNIWKLGRDTAMLNNSSDAGKPGRHRTQKNRHVPGVHKTFGGDGDELGSGGTYLLYWQKYLAIYCLRPLPLLTWSSNIPHIRVQKKNIPKTSKKVFKFQARSQLFTDQQFTYQ